MIIILIFDLFRIDCALFVMRFMEERSKGIDLEGKSKLYKDSDMKQRRAKFGYDILADSKYGLSTDPATQKVIKDLLAAENDDNVN